MLNDFLFGKGEDGARLLTTANGKVELMMLEGLLKDNEIPYLLKDHEAGNYMRIVGGFSIYGTDIRVRDEDYERAKELLDAYMPRPDTTGDQ